jgi:hypothetical protein
MDAFVANFDERDEEGGDVRRTEKVVRFEDSNQQLPEPNRARKKARRTLNAQSRRHRPHALVCSGKNARLQTKQMERRDFLAILSASNVRMPDIMSPVVNRSQLQQKFKEEYIPMGEARNRTLDFVVAAAQSQHSPALGHAISCISAHILARLNNDPRPLQGAAIEYGRAINCARHEMGKVQLKAVRVATTHFLSVCEIFDQDLLGEKAASAHAKYIITLMEGDRNDQEPLSAKDLSATNNVRFFAIFGAMVVRQCPLKPNELPLEAELMHPPGSVVSLVNIALLTLSVVEVSDVFCKRDQAPQLSCIYEQLQKVIQLQGRLHEWMTRFNKQMDAALYRTIAVPRQPSPAVRETRALFAHTYEFNELADAMIFTTYWMCLLVLSQVHLEIVDTYQHKLEIEHTEYLRLQRLSDEYADSLCMTMSFMGRPSNGWAGRLGAVRPLHFLMLHYQHQKHWAKLRWVKRCAEDIGCLQPKARPAPNTGEM